jgi:hypothetical protein
MHHDINRPLIRISHIVNLYTVLIFSEYAGDLCIIPHHTENMGILFIHHIAIARFLGNDRIFQP